MLERVRMQKKLGIVMIMAIMFLSTGADVCLQPKRHKKESLKKIQQHVIEQSKSSIIESSTLLEEVGVSIVEGSTLTKELGLRIKDLGLRVKEVVYVLDEGEEGLLGGEDRMALKAYSEKLTQLEVAIKKCKNDVCLCKSKNTKILQ